MKCEIERMEINYTFYFFAFLRKMIKKLLTFCYWKDRQVHPDPFSITRKQLGIRKEENYSL